MVLLYSNLQLVSNSKYQKAPYTTFEEQPSLEHPSSKEPHKTDEESGSYQSQPDFQPKTNMQLNTTPTTNKYLAFAPHKFSEGYFQYNNLHSQQTILQE
jgi:hypothetical protein